MRKLPIVERFYTFQGEGIHMGRAAFFIRLYGCPLHCHFCDSSATWHPDWRPDHIELIEPGKLVWEARQTGCRLVVITGGEPGMFDLTELTEMLADNDIQVHVETSGSFKLRGMFDWITVSPKWATFKHPDQVEDLRRNLWLADEIKIIVEHVGSIGDWANMILEMGLPPRPGRTIWLHPEWSQRENLNLLASITNAVKDNPVLYRAGYQVHKLYKSDLLDPRADKKLVPLGGDITKGY